LWYGAWKLDAGGVKYFEINKRNIITKIELDCCKKI
jgi:hypothetical protein